MKSAAVTIVLFVLYALLYAPFGINETDGGFITGLAWQILSGKHLYADVIYVRPPLPVWLRAAELQWLPDQWAILGERWIFYLKTALYSWLAASVLAPAGGWFSRRAWLSATGFVVSAHCYPAAAWHTTDGILFAVLSAWLLRAEGRAFALAGGCALALSCMCKQSFYPLAAFFPLLLWWQGRKSSAAWLLAGLSAIYLLLLTYLYKQGVLGHFLAWTSGAASGGQAVQHGLLDYFRINVYVVLAALILLLPVAGYITGRTRPRVAWYCWLAFLAAMTGAYLLNITREQAFVLPFAQVRLLFDLAIPLGCRFFLRKKWSLRESLQWLMLMAVSWCAAVSWGYSLPILLSTPWLWVLYQWSEELTNSSSSFQRPWAPWLVLAVLAGVFGYAYRYVYRDGPRREMTEHLGDIFPSLTGIYSNQETAGQYRELRDLAIRYGPAIKTIPAFTQASFLTKTRPPLPLDWVVDRESGGAYSLLNEAWQTSQPVWLAERTFDWKKDTTFELHWVREIMEKGEVIETTQYFQVIRYNKSQ